MARSNLQNTRLSREMSQSQLATAAAINGRVLQTYEQGGRDLSGAKLATLLKICLALNCKLEDILPDGETAELLKRLVDTELCGVVAPRFFFYEEDPHEL